MPSLGRRRLLGALAVSVLGAGAVGGAMIEDVLPGGARLRRAVGLTGTDGKVPAVSPGRVRTETERSRARGRDVRLVVMDPPGADRSDLPVCLALHGHGGDATNFVDLGVPQFLAEAVGAGAAPFRVVAVDGGDSYWHARTPADDPMAMLTAELPGWLAARRLAAPSAVLGISMGGSGALQYARAHQGRLSAVALLSPALFRNWGDARTVDAYRDQADWQAHEPLQHLDQLGRVDRIGVWCGTEDPFCPAARKLSGPPATRTSFPRGEHTAGFWRRVMPDAMALLAGR
ncbi:alpha/beta hydrolase [Kitasatospora cheerisanensis]|uniref:Acyl-CoA:diacylglycerol acyltransferase n=1 Tax=Kitasatospora cheerisanensis KCTC 2395 TaxID=1348663 RepID=A0A066Z3R7_9ACTN|nr:alpha/beta hydrolase-fold protein [Kitasatospora cheerisanensis]KDN86889.1 hypothetical protein KCH_13350 [Kitasatospora cheerisanensis KCTC 2395]